MDAYEMFEGELREAVENVIERLGGYDSDGGLYFTVNHYNQVRDIFERVRKDALYRFNTDKPPRGSWPDVPSEELNLTKQFTEFYGEPRRMVIQRNDREGQERIKTAGGQPFQREKYEDTGYRGNMVVEADISMLMRSTRLGRRTVQDRLARLVDAGVLIRLNTVPNKPGLFVIGDWVGGKNGSYRANWRLNRRGDKDVFRKMIRAGLVEQGFLR